jgi:ferredoxin
VRRDRVISVDRERCIGSGMCSFYAPSTFSQDAEAKAVVLDAAGDAPDAVRTAIEACPTQALRTTDDQEG